MAVTKDVEDVEILFLLSAAGVVFFSTFQKDVKDFLNGLSLGASNAATGTVQTIGSQLADGLKNAAVVAGNSAGTAVTSVGTGAIQGAGDTLGDWIWNGLSAIFPSLTDTSADQSSLNKTIEYTTPTGDFVTVDYDYGNKTMQRTTDYSEGDGGGIAVDGTW